MINPISGWSWNFADGMIYLFPPEGIEVGGIHYTERVRPVLDPESLIRALPVPDDYAITGVSPVEQLLTREGEYAILATVRGTQAGQELVRTVGAVYGDDFQAVIVGTARRPVHVTSIAAHVRTLVVHDQHFLGVRRRRFRYQRPRGWDERFVAPFHVHHGSPDGAVIVVHPAVPGGADLEHIHRTVAAMAGDERIEMPAETAPEPADAAAGLDGASFTVVGRARTLVAVFLGDDRYSYPITLACPNAAAASATATLRALIRTVEPLPRARIAFSAASPAAFTHWAE